MTITYWDSTTRYELGFRSQEDLDTYLTRGTFPAYWTEEDKTRLRATIAEREQMVVGESAVEKLLRKQVEEAQ